MHQFVFEFFLVFDSEIIEHLLLILQKFWKSSFSDATKVQNARLPMVQSQVKPIKSIFADKGIVNKLWGTSSLN